MSMTKFLTSFAVVLVSVCALSQSASGSIVLWSDSDPDASDNGNMEVTATPDPTGGGNGDVGCVVPTNATSQWTNVNVQGFPASFDTTPYVGETWTFSVDVFVPVGSTSDDNIYFQGFGPSPGGNANDQNGWFYTISDHANNPLVEGEWVTLTASNTVDGDANDNFNFLVNDQNTYSTDPSFYFDNILLTVTPEPGSLSLAGFALLGALTVVRRRRK